MCHYTLAGVSMPQLGGWVWQGAIRSMNGGGGCIAYMRPTHMRPAPCRAGRGAPRRMPPPATPSSRRAQFAAVTQHNNGNGATTKTWRTHPHRRCAATQQQRSRALPYMRARRIVPAPPASMAGRRGHAGHGRLCRKRNCKTPACWGLQAGSGMTNHSPHLVPSRPVQLRFMT